MVFHCSGQALTVEMYRRALLVDGVVNPSVVERYSFTGNQGTINQTLIPPEIKTDAWPTEENRSYNIQNLENFGQGQFEMAYFRNSNNIIKEELTILRVNETNELLINFKSNKDNNKVCPDGSKPESLLVPLPNDLFS